MGCTHPTFTYALMHMSAGGGIAVLAICLAVVGVAWALFH